MVKQVTFSSKKPARIVESRRTRRREANATGKIVCEGGRAFNCTIRDISDLGASIRVSESHRLPSRFYLIHMQSGAMHEAEVAWVAYAQRGVRFVQTFGSHDRLPPYLESWRRLWLIGRD